MSNQLKIEGLRFNRLTVLSYEYTKSISFFKCLCDCGNVKILSGSLVKNGYIKSCGCYRDEKVRIANKKNNPVRNDREYHVWASIKSRCYNKNTKQYKNYGGRGITMCKTWINSYSKFIEDMGKKPTPKHTIERIDNNLGYCKSNCKWATYTEQANNRRGNIKVKHIPTGMIFNSISSAADNFGLIKGSIINQLYLKRKSDFIKI
jgi:hypothetical protein